MTCWKRTGNSPPPCAGGSGTCSSTRCRTSTQPNTALLHLLIGDEPDLFVVGDPKQLVGLRLERRRSHPAQPVARACCREPGSCVLDENHRSSPQVVTVATAALGLADESAPSSTRLDGPVPGVVDHPTEDAEAAWVARQLWRAHVPRGAARSSSPCWPGPMPGFVPHYWCRAPGRADPVQAGRHRRQPHHGRPYHVGHRRRPTRRSRRRGRRAVPLVRRRRCDDRSSPSRRRGQRGGRRPRGAGPGERGPHDLPPGQRPPMAGRLRDRDVRRPGALRRRPDRPGPPGRA